MVFWKLLGKSFEYSEYSLVPLDVTIDPIEKKSELLRLMQLQKINCQSYFHSLNAFKKNQSSFK